MKYILTIWVLLFSSQVIIAQELVNKRLRVSNVTAVRYSHNAEFVAVNSKKELLLLSAESNIEIKKFDDFKKNVRCLAFSPNDELIMGASDDGIIRIWETLSGKQRYNIDANNPIIAVEFSGNDQLVLITENEVISWDLNENKQLWSVHPNKQPLRALAVSENLGKVAVGGGDGLVQLLNLSDGKIISNLNYHDDWVRSLAFHPEKPVLASGSDDGVVLTWDLQENKMDTKIDDLSRRIYGLTFSHNGEFLIYSAETLNFFSFERNYKTLQIDNFIADIIAIDLSPKGNEILTIEDLVPTVKTWDIGSLNLATEFVARDESDKSAPLIYLANPANLRNDRVMVYADIMALRGTITDDSGVHSLKVNGIETPVRANGSFVINLPLATGENYVSIEASDLNSNIALKKFVIERRNVDGSEYVSEDARNFLFIVGINDYQQWPKLSNAVKDISDITSILLSKYRFEFENIIMLKDEQATRANIFSSLRSLIEKITPRDNLIIYFSGHGYFDDLLNEGYWVPYEAPKNSTGDYIPNGSILRIVENINSQHTFLVADACFSGSLFSASSRGYVENVEKFKSRWGLASGRLEVVSDGAQGGNSPFASYFIEFLRENSASYFPVSELVQYVKVKTAEFSQQTPIGNPLKSLGDEGGEFIFYKKN